MAKSNFQLPLHWLGTLVYEGPVLRLEKDWKKTRLDWKKTGLLQFLSSYEHVEHAFSFSVLLFTCFFLLLFQGHVLYLFFSFLLQHAVYTFTSYMCLTGLLHMFSMPLT